MGGGGQFGQTDGLGETGAHEIEGGPDRGMKHTRGGGGSARGGVAGGGGREQKREQFDEFSRAPERPQGGGRGSREERAERLHGKGARGQTMDFGEVLG